MTKKEALQEAIEQGKEYGYISWDDILDICDEEMSLVRYVNSKLEKMNEKGEIEFEITN